MSAADYLAALRLTHEKERPDWPEPQWTAYLCLLNLNANLIRNLERAGALKPEEPCSPSPLTSRGG